ncbi:hypothetical protein P280DRAFT_286009 [Massarina eburnea CBS 473.64]|uniref:Uncharacterized protein n=1 Tax=Massarina eburnea CBS 473.64 TaxID=1395130 RepID=A0A6A6S1W8_9PLEO|nr:hypothetical protein P280DRAFT_286009 [Massarina eburnea CBS 473.64]
MDSSQQNQNSALVRTVSPESDDSDQCEDYSVDTRDPAARTRQSYTDPSNSNNPYYRNGQPPYSTSDTFPNHEHVPDGRWTNGFSPNGQPFSPRPAPSYDSAFHNQSRHGYPPDSRRPNGVSPREQPFSLEPAPSYDSAFHNQSRHGYPPDSRRPNGVSPREQPFSLEPAPSYDSAFHNQSRHGYPPDGRWTGGAPLHGQPFSPRPAPSYDSTFHNQSRHGHPPDSRWTNRGSLYGQPPSPGLTPSHDSAFGSQSPRFFLPYPGTEQMSNHVESRKTNYSTRMRNAPQLSTRDADTSTYGDSCGNKYSTRVGLRPSNGGPYYPPQAGRFSSSHN